MAKEPQSGKTTRVPAELAREIATTRDGRDITRPFTSGLQQPRDPRLLGSVDWGIYDRILLDDQVKSCWEQRVRAVVSRPWDVLPGDDDDPRSVEAGDAFKRNIEAIGWDRVTEKMLSANFYGYSAAEVMWGPWEGMLGFTRIHVRHARRFRFDQDGALRLLTTGAATGEPVPDRKFWTVVAGGTDDDELYGRGLAEWLYWPFTFKRNGIRFWNQFLDKYSLPPIKGTYRPGTPREDIEKLLQTIVALANDSGVVVPEGVGIEMLKIAASGVDFEKMPARMDEAIAKIILSQTMTTQNGSSLSQAKVHEGVKLEIIKADADLLTDSFTAGPARWWTDLNYGPDVAAPRLVRIIEEEEDLKAQAETDESLSRLGWRRSEDSFRDTYGDGYEYSPPAAPVAPTDPADAPAAKPGEPPASFAASDPRPLYVYRRLLNARDLIAWAQAQGFQSTLPAQDMHVTIAYSRTPINWFSVPGLYGSPQGELTVPAGGARMVDRLGDQGAVVLHFTSDDLAWRNRNIREAGASWDFPEYLPHVTLTYAGGDIDLTAIEAYQGPLIFGPEIFEPIVSSWQADVDEVSFAAPDDRDAVDLAAQALLDAGFAPIAPIVSPIVDAIRSANSVEELDAALIASLDQAKVDQFVTQLARAGFALRIAAEAGEYLAQ